MHAITFRSAGYGEIDRIRALWEQLNEHHHAQATTFRVQYERMTFEDRRNHFAHLSTTGLLQLDLAADSLSGTDVGYCVSSLSPEKAGELESLFVAEAYRSAGIGTTLVKRALAWMDSCGAVRKRVSVGAGNEPAFAFYRKFGFYPRMTVLEQWSETDGSDPGPGGPAGNP